MLFALICKDKVGMLDVRMANRPDHLAFLEGLGDQLKAAGPFASDGGSPIGSLVVIDTKDRAGAEEIAAKDPYAIAGLFESVDVIHWKWLINNPEND
jgi:uncharacterized protein YciI